MLLRLLVIINVSAVWVSAVMASPDTLTLPGVYTPAGYTYQGCFEDKPIRSLPHAGGNSGLMTVDKCAIACSSFEYFGMENGNECWCSNAPPIYGVVSLADAQANCVKLCVGSSAQTCGGFYRLNVYKKNAGYVAPPPTVGPYTDLKCYEYFGGMPLTEGFFVDPTLTREKCVAECAGFYYAVIRGTTQCLCGNKHSTHRPINELLCHDYTCPGNPNQFCGSIFIEEYILLRLGNGCPTIEDALRVKNPGFENGDIDWAPTSSPSKQAISFSVITDKSSALTQKHFGRRAGRIMSTSTTASLQLVQRKIPVCPGVAFTVSLWSRGVPDSQCTGTIKINGVNLGNIPASTDWIQTELPFTPDVDTAELVLTFACAGTKNQRILYIDDVLVKAVGIIPPANFIAG